MSLKSIAEAEDQIAHSAAYYKRQLRASRELCDEQAILIGTLQDRVAELEAMLLMARPAEYILSAYPIRGAGK